MGSMSGSDAAPLPRLGEVFFDVRGSTRSMRLSWLSDTGIAVFSIWQGGTCTGTFRLPASDLTRLVDSLQRGGPEDELTTARHLAEANGVALRPELTASPGASGPEPYTGMMASLAEPAASAAGYPSAPGTALAALPAAPAPEPPAPEPAPVYPDPYGGEGGQQPFPDARPYTASVVADYGGGSGYNGFSSLGGTNSYDGGSPVPDNGGYPGGTYGAPPDYARAYPGYSGQQQPAPAGESTQLLGPDQLAHLMRGQAGAGAPEPEPQGPSMQDFLTSMSSGATPAGSGADSGFFSRPATAYSQQWPGGAPPAYGQQDPYAASPPPGGQPPAYDAQPPAYDGFGGQPQGPGESPYPAPAPEMNPYDPYAGSYSTVRDRYGSGDSASGTGEDPGAPVKPAGFPGTDVYPSGNYPVPAANGYQDAGTPGYGRGGNGSPFPPPAGNGTGPAPRPGFTPSFSPAGAAPNGGAPNGGGRHSRQARGGGQPPQRPAGRPGSGSGGYPDGRNGGGYPGGRGPGYGRPGYGDAPGARGPRPGGGAGRPSFVPNGPAPGRPENRGDPREQRYGRGR